MNNVPDFHSIIESNDIGYQSPIEVILQRMQTKIEEDCMETVQRYGFNINKEELEKALRYDRDQYRKGYEAARIQYARPKGEWKPFVYDYDIGGDHTRPPKEGEEPHWEEYWAQEFKCSICGCKNHMANYCPSCGAEMERGAEE